MDSSVENSNFQKSYSCFLTYFFSKLEANGIVWCVLRNYEGLPDDIGNDVDLLISITQKDKCEKILCLCTEECGWRMISISRRLGYFGAVLTRGAKDGWRHIKIDLLTRLLWRGMPYCSEKEILDNRLYRKGFFIPVPGAEGASILVKELLSQRKVRKKYHSKLPALIQADAKSFFSVLTNHFPKKKAKRLFQIVEAADWDALEAEAMPLRKALFKYHISKNPIAQMQYWGRYLANRFRDSLIKPPGAFIVLTGPDGSGKTTIAKVLQNTMGGCFKLTVNFHHRPGYLPPLSHLWRWASHKKRQSGRFYTPQEIANQKVWAETHRHSPYRIMMYVLYYFCDYIMGYKKIISVKSAGGLIIADRYFYDFYLLSIYSRVPKFLLRLIEQFIPSPTIVIFLSADIAFLMKRKQELTEKEMRRQLERGEQLIARLPQGFKVDASQSVEDVVEAIGECFFEVGAMQTVKKSNP